MTGRDYAVIMKKLRQTNITIEERKDKFGQTTSFRVRYFENSHRCSQSFKDRVSAESFVNCIKSARSIPSDIKFSVAGLVHQARFQEVCASLKLEVPAAYDECISYLTAKYSVTNPGMLLGGISDRTLNRYRHKYPEMISGGPLSKSYKKAVVLQIAKNKHISPVML